MVKKRGEVLNTNQVDPKRVQRYGLFWKMTAFFPLAFRDMPTNGFRARSQVPTKELRSKGGKVVYPSPPYPFPPLLLSPLTPCTCGPARSYSPRKTFFPLLRNPADAPSAIVNSMMPRSSSLSSGYNLQKLAATDIEKTRIATA